MIFIQVKPTGHPIPLCPVEHQLDEAQESRLAGLVSSEDQIKPGSQVDMPADEAPESNHLKLVKPHNGSSSTS